MVVLKAHNQRTTEKLANMYIVSSYHSTATEARDSSYFKKTNAFRDLMKAQNDKTNKLEALIKIGDLYNNEYTNLGLKVIELHRFMQDRRQIYHDAALTKAHGPTHVRPRGPVRFEKEVRYAASTTSIEIMQPIEQELNSSETRCNWERSRHSGYEICSIIFVAATGYHNQNKKKSKKLSKKLSKSCQKVVKKLSKSCYKFCLTW
jgi:hypothetical protein